ncbi:MAG: macro domain-containing protein [bacterium]
MDSEKDNNSEIIKKMFVEHHISAMKEIDNLEKELKPGGKINIADLKQLNALEILLKKIEYGFYVEEKAFLRDIVVNLRERVNELNLPKIEPRDIEPPKKSAVQSQAKLQQKQQMQEYEPKQPEIEDQQSTQPVAQQQSDEEVKQQAQPQPTLQHSAQTQQPEAKKAVTQTFEHMIKTKINKCSLKIVLGDLVQIGVQAIVSPDSTKLSMDRGVPAVIRLKGGESIFQEVEGKGNIAVGASLVTGAGELPFKHIIHTAITEDLEEINRNNMSKSINEVFRVIDELKIESIALPAFGTPVSRFPYDICAKIMLPLIIENLQKRKESSMKEVFISLFNKQSFESFKNQLDVLKDLYLLIIDK